MTDRTIKKTDELYRSQQERIGVLEAEKQELVELNEQLEAEIYSLKKMASYRGDDGMNEMMQSFCSYPP